MRRAQILLPLLVTLSLLLGSGGLVRAQSATYDLSWWAVDGGGVSFSQLGDYSLSGTAGQPDAATWLGEPYSLTGGFWDAARMEVRAFMPVLLRES
jgi:hypothetical protein